MASRAESEVLTVAGREVAVSNPSKVLFPDAGYTKLDLVRYYLAVADGALRAAGDRPNVLVRYPNGIGGEFFYQKRAPDLTARLDRRRRTEDSRRGARRKKSCRATRPRSHGWPTSRASSCIRIRCAPMTSIIPTSCASISIRCLAWSGRRFATVAGVVHATLKDFGLVGWPKTSGSRGMHIYVRIERRWTFAEVRRAALAFAREVERRAPDLATSKWWKEERHGVFLDYNQNAKDRTVAAAYSVRPKPDARVSAPLTWEEIDTCDPGDFTLATMPDRFRQIGDPHAAMDEHAGSIEGLLELSKRHAKEGLGDAPWPPHYQKQADEPPRVQPSRRRIPKRPLIEIGRAEKKEDALAGLERWRARHPEAAAHLQPADVLVDAMRGRFHTWTRIRVNLQHVPEELRPPQEALDPDEEVGGWGKWPARS